MDSRRLSWPTEREHLYSRSLRGLPALHLPGARSESPAPGTEGRPLEDLRQDKFGTQFLVPQQPGGRRVRGERPGKRAGRDG